MDWLKDAPNLASVGRRTPFTVPSGYFEESSAHLNAYFLAEANRFAQEEEFNIPSDYFDELPERIENRIAIENIKNLVPSVGFAIPEDYFTDLSGRINSRITQIPSRRKPLRRILSTWIPYSAAACITLLIGSLIYFNSFYYSFGKQLSEVPDQTIINYLQVNSTINDTQFIIENISTDGLQQITTDVSSEELEQYIKNTTL